MSVRDSDTRSNDQLTASAAREKSAVSKPEGIGGHDKLLAIAAESLESTRSQRSSRFLFGANQANGSEWVERDNELRLSNPFMENVEKLPFKASSIFFETSSQVNPNRSDLKPLRSKVEERDRKIFHLESELGKTRCELSIAIEQKHHELEKLKTENLFREEKMMTLQSQLAGYMLKETTGTSQRHLGLACSSTASTSPSSICYNSRAVIEEEENGDDTLTFRDLDSDLPVLSKRSSQLSRSKSFRLPSVMNLCRPIPRILSRSQSQRDVEAELLRQLDFVQEEKRMDLRELENTIQDRDAIIKRCRRTMSLQEIQHLSKSFSGNYNTVPVNFEGAHKQWKQYTQARTTKTTCMLL